MGTVTVAEVKDRPLDLLLAAERGETIVITREGRPVAELGPAAGEIFDLRSIDWLRRETAHLPRSPVSGADLVRAMRDED